MIDLNQLEALEAAEGSNAKKDILRTLDLEVQGLLRRPSTP